MTIERRGSGGPWEETFGYSRVVKAGPLVLVAGCTSTVGGVVVHVGDPAAQAKQCFQIALDAMAGVGASISDVVRTRMYVVNPAHVDAIGHAHGEVFGAVKPVATMIMVAALIDPEHLVEVEVEAYLST
jgi:enamine deaminase RidA (YjgF/YER057c/UK114 family)